MRKIINSTYITLDGVIEGPHLWPSFGDVRDERFDEIQTELALACDGVLMGRRTYDVSAQAWPTRSGDALSDQMNSMAKYVVSTTLRDPEWANTQVIDGDVVAEITRLKEAPGKDIVQYGFGPVSRLLLEHGLLDELRLWMHPLILGTGSPSDLLIGEAPAVGFQLADATTLSNGVVILSYQTDSGYVTSVLGPTLLIAIGIGLTFPTLMAAATAGVPQGDAGIIGGLANTASQVGGSVGLAALATAASARAATEAGGSSPAAALAAGYDLVFLMAAGLGLAIAVVSVLDHHVHTNPHTPS